MSSDPQPFRKQRALITGGTKGIGKAAALRLARGGARVHLTYAHDQQAAEQTLAQITALGAQASLHRADMAQAEQIEALMSALHAEGPLDMVLANAAYEQKAGFLQTDLALMQRTLAVNVLGNFQLIQLAARKMIEAGVKGRIVICSSPHGSLVFEDALAYDVSKAALNHLMRGVALALIPHGIRVNAVDIGWTLTPGERRFSTLEEQMEISARCIPIGRSADADEIAAAIEFLCSDQASYVVGSLFLVDGGFCLRPATTEA